ncbi:MAG: hypothetical protein MI867_06265 [Pseudomonadales bacterium]|nr:hypothetical protein [Pseudomonadales bacterium]
MSERLHKAGLNLQHSFLIADLPQEIRDQLVISSQSQQEYRQLLLLGHGGKELWQALETAKIKSNDPVDDYTVQQIRDFLAQEFPGISFEIIYPGEHPVGLQKLGELAGWHFPSPFRVGINDYWGTWFAYRAVVLLENVIAEPSSGSQTNYKSPCVECATKPCVERCPVGAVSVDGFDADACMQYRKSPQSACRHTCLARVACPVGSQHRYSDEQLHYHYTCSLNTILEHY